jgi:hypothetical protein
MPSKMPQTPSRMDIAAASTRNWGEGAGRGCYWEGIWVRGHSVARIGFVLQGCEAQVVAGQKRVCSCSSRIGPPVLLVQEHSLRHEVCAVGCRLWSSGLVGCDPVVGSCGEGCCRIEGCEGAGSAGEGLALIALEAVQGLDETGA